MRSRALALAIAVMALSACERSPSAPSVNEGLPQSEDGRRTSVPGKAMDRAEDLKKEIDAYNQAIDDTISQGTNDAPAKSTTDKPATRRRPSGSP